jgi:hypothetical protein
MPIIDLTGRRFHRLTVVSMDTDRGRLMWRCRCDCGNERIVRGDCLKDGNTKSCGCLLMESATKHGHDRSKRPSPTYVTWQAMIARCTKPQHDSYYAYGAKGITVCARWREDFRNFLADMGERPNGQTIDRIDSASGYEPSNCRWATPKQQSWNRRSNRLMTLHGATKSVAEWAHQYGLPRTVVQDRLRLGWSFDRAVRTKHRPR